MDEKKGNMDEEGIVSVVAHYFVPVRCSQSQ